MKSGARTIFVVTPSFNAEQTIERTILSVITQAGDFEIRYHVQDGGSSDRTVEILRLWRDELCGNRIPLHCRGVTLTFDSAPDDGMYAAVLTGFGTMRISPDDFMTWINADDILLPGTCALVNEVSRKFGPAEVAWLGGGTSVIKDDRPIVQGERPTPTYAIRKGMCDGHHWHFVQQEGTFFRRALWEAADAPRALAGFRLAGDWNLWRTFAGHAEFTEVPWPLASFRLRQGQLSQLSRSAYMAEIDATIPPQEREAALRWIGDNEAPLRRILRSSWPTGELQLVQRRATHAMFERYKRVFGTRPAIPWTEPPDEPVVFMRNSGQQRSGEGGMQEARTAGSSERDAIEFENYTYARRSHWQLFSGLGEELFGEPVDPDRVHLKYYQDLFVLWFVQNYIPKGSRLLDVGGGQSRVLKHLAATYECWNIDKLEGLGNGPTGIGNAPYRLVRDYMGNFNPELPNDYFDLVFSISALEHVPQDDRSWFDKIIDDINRVLKPGGLSLHLFDVILKPNSFWTNKFTEHIFSTVRTINKAVSPSTMRQDPDFYGMTEEAYNKTWLHTTKKPYSEHGVPSSLNILWRKAAEQPVKAPRVESRGASPAKRARWDGRFCIVTPCKDAIATIDRTIQSVIAQEGGITLRYHVQDGGSTDGTVERIEQWQRKIAGTQAYRHVSFTWDSRHDDGMYGAVASGLDGLDADPDDFLSWINADDVLLPGALLRVAQVARLDAEIQWVGGTTYVIDERDAPVIQRRTPVPTEVIREGLCDGLHWDHLQQEGLFFRKALWFKGKHALRGFKLAGDWSLWKEFARHALYHQIDRALGAFRRRPGQLSVVRRADYDEEIERALPGATRREAFDRLYSAREAIYCAVVHVGDPDAVPAIEWENAAAAFERFHSQGRALAVTR